MSFFDFCLPIEGVHFERLPSGPGLATIFNKGGTTLMTCASRRRRAYLAFGR